MALIPTMKTPYLSTCAWDCDCHGSLDLLYSLTRVFSLNLLDTLSQSVLLFISWGLLNQPLTRCHPLWVTFHIAMAVLASTWFSCTSWAEWSLVHLPRCARSICNQSCLWVRLFYISSSILQRICMPWSLRLDLKCWLWVLVLRMAWRCQQSVWSSYSLLVQSWSLPSYLWLCVWSHRRRSLAICSFLEPHRRLPVLGKLSLHALEYSWLTC